MILHVGTAPQRVREHPSLDWTEQRLTIPGLRRHLQETLPDALSARRCRTPGLPPRRGPCSGSPTLRDGGPSANCASCSKPPASRPSIPKSCGPWATNCFTTSISRAEPRLPATDSTPCSGGAAPTERPPSPQLAGSNGHLAALSPGLPAKTVIAAAQNPASTAETAVATWAQFANAPLRSLTRRKLIPQLRRHLEERLPAYMVPAALVDLDSIPLTPHGKVDRKALPEPEPDRPELDLPMVAPRTPAEREIARIWAEVLRVEKVGIHDNFFDLGGHSLLATQVICRINGVFPIKLPLRRIFETPTVAGLAQAIEGTGAAKVRDSLLVLKPGQAGPAMFMVHDGLGDTTLYKNLVSRMPESLKVYGIEPHSNGYCPILHTRIPEIAAYYVEQVRQTQPEGPYLLASMCAGGMVAFEMALQLEAQGLPVAFVALMDAPGPRMRVKTLLARKRQLDRFTSVLRTGEGSSWLERRLDQTKRAGASSGIFWPMN